MESPLQEWRKEHGLTQKQTSVLAGVSAGHISHVESGISALGDKLADFLRGCEGGIHVIDEHPAYMEEKRDQLLTMSMTPAGKE